ncbi:inorganic phosphate transporter [Neosynechococcus sphagnicola]|uniref:inorganic phosphate transporter n=1 Tax=Neosynechococcus sphagnicola TaxID=1501145 RepID=UPI003B831E64
MLLASRLGLPVSTSHALVGAVVGIGLIRSWGRRSPLEIRLQTLRGILLAWLLTIPMAAALAGSLFWGLHQFCPWIAAGINQSSAL